MTTESGATALRSAFRCDLVGLATAWTHGAVKAVPTEWQLDGAALRSGCCRPGARTGGAVTCWRLDPHAPQTHLPLIAAATRLGISPARVGRGAALRISGTRRIARLVELVGPAPPQLAPTDWPRYWGRTAP